MKWLLTLSLLMTVSFAQAEVGHEDVESMLQQMVRENVISAQEAEKAKIRMKTMSPEQWSAVNMQAAKVAARTPASVTPSQNKIEEVNGIDLDGAQFKAIQSEVRKIVPQYKD
jgi:hypothetical protein